MLASETELLAKLPQSWPCPFCGHHATITHVNRTIAFNSFTNGNKYGEQGVRWTAITCPNPACREYAFSLIIGDYEKSNVVGKSSTFNKRHAWQLVPPAQMKLLPDYVPAPIVADYKEACLIATLSPKASATLARRCLQGMIRDFWGINKKRLYDEIEALRDKVDGETWDAIDAVRKIGNIGAHMEADINVIVDVEPEEARLLIELIENLVDEWYVARHDRQMRNAQLVALAEAKEAQKGKPLTA